ncbi:hydantoinase B/oxoprolinase family protein [Desulfosporosinus fructosivorans]|uniref:Hydantoinase B/oxoprolinase family protein n=1 Tax=Desulfosporosinus fructosivorans TaxID=2018669 RepID=A0A4Z0R408_9FIRM|nr:hydantoinase B/oxoprolinase family protein [Desulfosporosinus fructosivorans]TGE37125.1 hydantoinase B/oxoprolinase family protein [Desulfosporosinus fructosivorans]
MSEQKIEVVADLITLDIIKDSLQAIGEEMFYSVARTSQSPIIYEVLDFASGLTDEQGRLLTQGNGVAGFLGMLSSMVKEVIEKYTSKGKLKEGDIIIINDPYGGGGSHLQDVGLVIPVYIDGEIFCYCANKCHWSEMGGKDPGYSVDSNEIYQEGLQLPCIKLFNEGVISEAIIDIIRSNVRLPDMSIGDMWAQISGLRTGEKRIRELCAKYGKQTVKNAIERLLKNSAEYSRSRVAAIPDGVYTADGFMDRDVLGNGPFHIQTVVTIKGDRMIVDFTGSAPQTSGPINLSRTGLISAMRSIFLACTGPEQDINDGVFEPLEIIAEKGSIFSAQRPAAVSCYYESMQFALDLVWQAMAPVVEKGRLTAGHFLTVGAYSLSGRHSVTGDPFVDVGPTLGGWGAGVDRDGDSAQFCTGDGETYNIPAEVLEAKFGYRVTEYSLNTNSAGAGEYKGGYGIILGHQALNDNVYFSGTYGRFDYPAWGYKGGQDGSPNGFDFIRRDGTYEPQAGTGSKILLHKGDIVRMVTGSGGGYGNPLKRPGKKVALDVKNGYITVKDAEEIYGVLVDETGNTVLGITEARKALAV